MNFFFFIFSFFCFFFFFNDPATTEIYTLSLHDALPIWPGGSHSWARPPASNRSVSCCWPDRKSTRLNSSLLVISYAVFCLKKKKKKYRRCYKQKKKKKTNKRIEKKQKE